MDGPRKDGLGQILQATAVKIYRASSQYGPFDAEAEYRFITKLDKALGFSETETGQLIRDCRRFAAMAAGDAPVSETKAAS